MDIIEFSNYVVDKFKERFPDCDAEVIDQIKNNGVRIKSLRIYNNGNRNISPVINLCPLYTQYAIGNLSFSEIFEQIIYTYENNYNVDDIADFKVDIDNIYLSVINRRRNADLLKTCPFKEYADLAIVFRILVKQDADGIASSLLTDYLVEKFQIPLEGLYEKALDNTVRLFPSEYTPIHEVINSYAGGDIVEYPDTEDTFMVLSNSSKINGFTAILYPDVIKMLRESENEFYVLPSSVHESLLLPVVGSEPEIKNLQQMVQQVNQECVSEVEFLSNNVYVFDKESGCLHVVE